MSSPTVIFHAVTQGGFITVTDVSGEHYVQQYTNNNSIYPCRSGNTLLDHSEVYASGDNAIACAKQLIEKDLKAWQVKHGFDVEHKRTTTRG